MSLLSCDGLLVLAAGFFAIRATALFVNVGRLIYGANAIDTTVVSTTTKVAIARATKAHFAIATNATRAVRACTSD